MVADGVLWVSGVGFRVVVLPPMSTVRLDTLGVVKELCDSGGVVLAFGRLPSTSVEGGRDDPQLWGLLEAMFGLRSSEGYAHETWVADPVSGDVREDHFASSIKVSRNEGGGTAFFVPGEQNRGTNASAVDVASVLSGVLKRDVAVPAPRDWRVGGKLSAPPAGVLNTLCEVSER